MSAEKSTRIVFWCTAALLGFLQAWPDRMLIVNDTVSYLDMGRYLMSGQWSAALSGEWNPLYAAILGLLTRAVHPAPYWEYPLVHALLFVIFLMTCGCFELFLREMILLRESSPSGLGSTLPRWPWLALAYVVFLWSALTLIGVSETNPDMLVAAFFLLACACLVRIRRGAARPSTYGMLGAVLGIGYLTKTIMFPVGLLCLAAAGILEWKLRRAHARGTLIAATAFLVIAGPYVGAISLAKGRLTIGESGWYNALRDLEGIPESHWAGGARPPDRLLHPTRRIFEHPATFEFGSPLPGSYPVWYDPSYWYEGAIPHYSAGRFASVVARNALAEAKLVIHAFNGTLIPAVVLLLCIGGIVASIRSIAGLWFLLVPAAAALAMYALRHVESRFLGGFLAVGLVSLILGVPVRDTPEVRRFLGSLAAVMWLMFAFFDVPVSVVGDFNRGELVAWRAANHDAEIVSGLQAMGLQPGDRIASLEYGNCAMRLRWWGCVGAATWVHLGHWRIVSEVYYSTALHGTAADDFWNSDAKEQTGVLSAMTASGARAVVTSRQPHGASAKAWKAVGDTGWYVHWLQPQPSVTPDAG